jgi:hypothetical protein
MKVCIGIRDALSDNLRSDNLRSESRWERQVLEALLDNPMVTDVYTSGYCWGKNHAKYRGKVNTYDDVILITHDYSPYHIGQHNWKAIITNIFCGPWNCQVDEVNNYITRFGKRFLFTIGYRSSYEAQVEYLGKFTNKDCICYLPCPSAPYVIKGSGFDRKILLWPYRIIFLRTIYESPPIKWALQKLQKDPSLMLKIVTGWKPNEVKDLENGVAVNLKTDMNEYIWTRPEFSPYLSVRKQVELIGSADWDIMLSYYAHAKIALPHERYGGGPPVEAGMHGVPFIGKQIINAPYADCPNYLWTESSEEQITLLERLHTDREFYDLIANSYRDYTEKEHSYDAFNKQLNAILIERNLV